MTAARTRIGTSDLEVFPLNLGGNVFGWTADRDTSFAVLDAYTAAAATSSTPPTAARRGCPATQVATASASSASGSARAATATSS